MPAVWGQYPVLPQSSSGLTHGSGCGLMAARWQIFFVSFLSFLRAHQLTISGGCNHQWLWLPLLTDMVGDILFFNVTAKSLQSCPTLCDPIDGSPPGSIAFSVSMWKAHIWHVQKVFLYYSEMDIVLILPLWILHKDTISEACGRPVLPGQDILLLEA